MTRWRGMADSLESAMHVVDENLRIVQFNRALQRWCKRLGLRRPALGQALFDLFPFLPARVRAEYRRVLRTRRVMNTLETTTLGQESITTQTTKAPVLLQGNEGGVITLVRDVTRRLQMAASLRESERAYRKMAKGLVLATADKDRLLRELHDREQMYREIYNATSEAIAVEDALTGKFVEVNEPMVRMYGYDSREDLMARSIGDLSEAIPPYTQEDALRLHELVMAGHPQVFEWLAKRKSGELFNVEVSLSYSPIRGRHRILAVVRDVSARKRAEEALKESENRYSTIFRGAAEGILAADVETRQLLFGNPAIAKMLGYPEDDLKGMQVSDIIPPESREYVLGLFDAQARGKRGVVQEVPLRRKDGSVFYADIKASLMVIGIRRCLVGFFSDVTDRRRAEAAIREARRTLERKVKVRTAKLRTLAARLVRAEEQERQRIANVLHEELQQTLTGARLMLGDLRNRSRGKAADPVLVRVDDALKSATAVTRSLCLDLRPPILYEAGIGPALKWLAADLKVKLDLTVQLQVDSSVEPKSREVRIFLFEAIRELLFNVVKHAGVKTAEVSALCAEGNRIRLDVTDEGRGFAASRRRSGGFGLFSLRERTESFGGELVIRSAPGKGTRVTLTVPNG